VNRVAAKMDYLGYRASELMLRPTPQLIAGYERRFGLRLPLAYCRFLLRYGGYYGSSYCPLQELAPYDDPVSIDGFLGFWPPGCELGDIRCRTEDLFHFAPPVFAPLADGVYNGCLVALKCSGAGAGHIYLLDDYGTADLPEEKVPTPNSPTAMKDCFRTLRRYFELQRVGRLPLKPEHEVITTSSGLRTVLFRLARSFEEFIDALQRPEERLIRVPKLPKPKKLRWPRPLNRLYHLLLEAGNRPYAIAFDRRRRVLWCTNGEFRAGVGEVDDGQVRVSYQPNPVDIHSQVCVPERAAQLIEEVMAGGHP